jgi:hypothetical protein
MDGSGCRPGSSSMALHKLTTIEGTKLRSFIRISFCIHAGSSPPAFSQGLMSDIRSHE